MVIFFRLETCITNLHQFRCRVSAWNLDHFFPIHRCCLTCWIPPADVCCSRFLHLLPLVSLIWGLVCGAKVCPPKCDRRFLIPSFLRRFPLRRSGLTVCTSTFQPTGWSLPLATRKHQARNPLPWGPAPTWRSTALFGTVTWHSLAQRLTPRWSNSFVTRQTPRWVEVKTLLFTFHCPSVGSLNYQCFAQSSNSIYNF